MLCYLFTFYVDTQRKHFVGIFVSLSCRKKKLNQPVWLSGSNLCSQKFILREQAVFSIYKHCINLVYFGNLDTHWANENSVLSITCFRFAWV